MFYTNKHKLEVLMLTADVLRLKDELSILKTQMSALIKTYPNGVNKDGQPRKKIGRPHKKVTA